MTEPAERPLRRVAVMGIAGSGKSTFAARLGEALGAPVFHLDAIYWRTGKPADWEDFRAAQRTLLAHERWVIDGNYSTGGLEERLARTDAVVFMEVSRWTALWRIVGRTLRGRGSAHSVHGNPGGLRWEFIRWVWNWKRNHPDFVDSLRRQLGDRPVIVVRGRRDAERFLDHARRCSTGTPTGGPNAAQATAVGGQPLSVARRPRRRSRS